MAAKSIRILPVALVSDRQEWVRRACEACRAVRTIPECETWSTVPSRHGPVAALVLDVTSPYEPKRRQLRKWAGKGQQPACILCVAPQRGAAELAIYAAKLGYNHVLYGIVAEFCEGLEEVMRRIIEKRAWVVPEVARVLKCYDHEIVRCLDVGLDLAPRHTVESWATELGLQRRQDLASIFSGRSLPPPKLVLEWLRLVLLVEKATNSPHEQTHDELARAFGYASGDYLRKHARRISAHSLSDLIKSGVQGTLGIMAECLARRRQE